MLDLAWSEIMLVAVVALVVIGPKDLPSAIRGIADLVKKGKKQLAQFQQQADELVREAKLEDVRNQIADVKGAINEIRSFDLKGHIEKTVDSDGTLAKTFNDSPVSATPAWTPPPTAADTPDAPAMIPPQTMAPYKPPEPEPQPEAPSFLPPSTPAPPNPIRPEPAVSAVPAPAPAEQLTAAPIEHAPASPTPAAAPASADAAKIV
ncbi:twin-arginine translocase subunit TatB [Roseococcus sp. SYP-B2431]|uniref:Sec-independent protein translocase protein TatB n=1 Tax=Roseococcus sp. SYP-B2431 TaxID=2496640 RepID=UPI00103D3418|nr:Sec-independent protein translocase protein TatB [Roseococcus sp. SYP-B2431]TCH97694.1 twin-arginine translocase subunit TatB [Roseococcus sp. SYP-B2431]